MIIDPFKNEEDDGIIERSEYVTPLYDLDYCLDKTFRLICIDDFFVGLCLTTNFISCISLPISGFDITISSLYFEL